MPSDLPPLLFEGVNDVDQYTAMRKFTTHDCAAGEVLLTAGDPGESVVCVVTGSLEVRAGASVVGTAGPGDLVGEMALFQKGARTATVVAAEPSRVMVLDRAGYEELRDVVHPVAMRLEQHAMMLQVQRLRAVGQRIAVLAQGTPMGLGKPIAGFFKSFASQFGRGGMFSTEEVSALPCMLRSPLFQGAPPPVLGQIATLFRVGAYAPGHVLCEEGEPGLRMFLLDEGEVDVVIRTHEGPQNIATLQRGAAFGMVSLAQNSERMSTCVTRSRCVVHELDHKGWRALIAEPYGHGSTFRRAMIKAFSQQLRYANAQLADFELTHTAELRLEDLMQATAGLTAHGSYLEVEE